MKKIPDEFFMQRCLQLAAMGLGRVAPNPLVGCVLAIGEKIIGEGYHTEFGGPHAEVNAINSVYDSALLPKAALYVSLEPCAHHGKTPPCTDLILHHRIPKVVIGCRDPFSKVNGQGVEILRQHGVEVIENVDETQCRFINRRFFTSILKKRPYIILKWAQTKNGFIAPLNPDKSGKEFRISNRYSQVLSHQWRTQEQAILVGTQTALIDNPQLTARYWNGKNPLRLVADRDLRLPRTLHLFDRKNSTVVFTKHSVESEKNLCYKKIKFENTPYEMLQAIHELNIQSVIVEGGSRLLQSFIDEGLWDEARVFTSHTYLSDGIKAPALKPINEPARQEIDNDLLEIFMN